MKAMRVLHLWGIAVLLVAAAGAAWAWHGLTQRAQVVADRSHGLDATVANAPRALLVDSLREGGDAERAGLRVGDRIEAVDHQRVKSRTAIDRTLISHHHARLQVRRGGRALDIDVMTHAG